MGQRRATIADGETVSVIMARNIKPGYEQQFWAVDKEIKDALMRSPGFLSVNHFPTTAKNNNENGGQEYITIAQFDSIDSLVLWEESPLRAVLFEQLTHTVTGDIRRKSITGLEGMFEPALPIAPPRYKMAIMIISVIFILLILLRPMLNALLPTVPQVFQSLILVIIQVLAMTYFIMPKLTKLLAKWLYR